MMSKPHRILKFLRDQAPFSPTLREIQDTCGISSTSVVAYNLDKLEREGLISRSSRNQSRSIRVASVQPLVTIDLAWIPAAELRGNSREHYMARHRYVSSLRDRGIEYGLLAKTERPDIDYPITGLLAVEITGWNPKQVDFDGLLIAYKALFDGMQVTVKRDEFGDVPGAGVFVDDKQIIDATIKTRIGPERSHIVIRRAQE